MEENKQINTVATPVVSVIVPTIGRPSLTRTISSILGQTYKDFEVIVVPNNLIAPISLPQDPRIVICEAFSGEMDWGKKAKQRGLTVARGEFACWLDDDDWWEPQFIRRMVTAIRNKGVDFLYCRTALHDRVTGRRLGSYLRAFDIEVLRASGFIISASVMFRRDVATGYMLRGGYEYEWIFYLDMANSGRKFAAYDSELAHYSTDDGTWKYWANGGYMP